MTKPINYFKANPAVDVFYFTTDGQAFRRKEASEAHQKSLTGKEKDVKKVTRDEVEGPGKADSDDKGSKVDIPEYNNLTKAEIITRLEEHEVALDKKADTYSKQELYDTLAGALKLKAEQAKETK